MRAEVSRSASERLRAALPRAQAGVERIAVPAALPRFGADVVVSEFVSAEGIRRQDARTHSYLRFHDDERPIGIQIFGADPTAMAEAAALVEEITSPTSSTSTSAAR